MKNGLHLPVCIVLCFFCSTLSAQSLESKELQEGITLYRQGKLPEAESVLKQYAETHPRHAETFYYLGRISLDGNDFSRARHWAEQAVSLDSANSAYHILLGRAYIEMARTKNPFKAFGFAKKAKKHWELAVRYDDNNIEARECLMYYCLNAPKIAGGGIEGAKLHAAEVMKRDTVRGWLDMARINERQKEWEKEKAALDSALWRDPDNPDALRALDGWRRRQQQHDDADR